MTDGTINMWIYNKPPNKMVMVKTCKNGINFTTLLVVEQILLPCHCIEDATALGESTQRVARTMKLYWLVVSIHFNEPPLWKIWVRQWVSDDIPYMKWKIKFMFETTNQYKHEVY